MLGKYRRRGAQSSGTAIAEEESATPAQVALAWLISRPAVTAPIASATSLEQLNEILGSAQLQLSEDARVRLEAASA